MSKRERGGSEQTKLARVLVALLVHLIRLRGGSTVLIVLIVLIVPDKEE